MTDREKLRKLAEAATPGPWSTAAFQLVIDVARRIDVGMCGHRDDAAFIAAANPAVVLGLLDQCDAAEAKLYAAEEKLGEIVAERDALRAHVHELRTELKSAEAQRQRLIQKEAEA